MSDLISNNPAPISPSVKSSGPREAQDSPSVEASPSSSAQEAQTMQATFATIVYNNERGPNSGFKGVSKNDKFINNEWTTYTNAVLAA
jgi:hypothetical protein